jgi:hypothetical protein
MLYKVIMAPIIFEEPSYEENELKKYRDFSCMFCNLSHEKRLWKKGYFIGSWYFSFSFNVMEWNTMTTWVNPL